MCVFISLRVHVFGRVLVSLCACVYMYTYTEHEFMSIHVNLPHLLSGTPRPSCDLWHWLNAGHSCV